MKSAPAGGDRRPSAKGLVPPLALLLVVLAAFLYTVEIRSPWFGTLSPHHHQWLTGSTLKFAKNWHREGAWNLRFWMLEDPASVEFPTPSSRGPYPSYPPGTILPIHALGTLLGEEPSPALVMGYNLANHLLIAVLLAFSVYILLRRVRAGTVVAPALAAIPPLFYLLLPGPLYWHQNVFFSDQAVMLPVVLFVFLEIVREAATRPRILGAARVLQPLVFFFGALTDWFFFVVALAVFLKRLVLGEAGKGWSRTLGHAALYWLPGGLALLLFLAQLHSLGMVSALVDKFLVRGGYNAEGSRQVVDFYDQFWRRNFGINFGAAGIWLAWGCLILWILALAFAFAGRRRGRTVAPGAKALLSLSGVYLLPCFLHNYFLRNHSINHDFSALKFAVPLAAVPFVLMPVLLGILLGKEQLFSIGADGAPDDENRASRKSLRKRGKNPASAGAGPKASWLLPLATVALIWLAAGVYLLREHSRFATLFPPSEPTFQILGDFFARNTGYEDVVFSPYFEIPENPPQMLSFTMKRVYKIAGVRDIDRVLAGIPGPCTVNLLVAGEQRGSAMVPFLGQGEGLGELVARADDVRQSGNLILFRIGKDKALALARTSAVR